MDYQKITAEGKSISLAVTQETDNLLIGWEVGRDGSRTHRMHVIDKSLITRRLPLAMNLTYGELEASDVR